MKRYNYIEIWNKVLSKYKISSFVYDIGDNLRKIHVFSLLNKVFRTLGNTKDPLIISDFGSGNWLYLDKIYDSIRNNVSDNKVHLSGFDFSRLALKWGVEKYKDLKPNNVLVSINSGNFLNILEAASSNSFDIILTLEVLEHLKNDREYLSLVFKVLKNSGLLIISVPNTNPLFPSLDWFRYVFNRKKLIEKDTVVGHYRRYSTKDVLCLLRESGFSIIETSHYDFVLSGYVEVFLSGCFKGDSIAKKVLFSIFLPMIRIEDFVFNLLKVGRSGGIFILAQKHTELVSF